MNKDFWITRWKEGKTAFHLENVNELLVRFFPNLEPKDGQKILVPLCGKTKDMVWLAQEGLEVYGVEFYEDAIKSFFTENKLPSPTIQKEQDLTHFLSEKISISCGDFFKFDQKNYFDFVYDRAALVALPEEIRKKYVSHLLQMLKPKGKCLLITYEYDQKEMEGPPFSVPENELRDLFQNQCSVERLIKRDIEKNGSKLSSLSSVSENVYRIIKHG